MDEYERRARQLDDEQKERFRRIYRGDREAFWNRYEIKIYQEIMRLFKKSRTYDRSD